MLNITVATLQKLWAPKHNHFEILHFEKKAQFYVRCNYSVPRSVNSAVILPYTANAALDQSGDMRSGRTRVYSEKPSNIW